MTTKVSLDDLITEPEPQPESGETQRASYVAPSVVLLPISASGASSGFFMDGPLTSGSS